MADVSKLAIAALAVGFLSLLLHIIGVATDYWTVLPNGHAGLWQACAQQFGIVVCASYDTGNLPARFNTARAFEILGVLEGGLAVMLLVLRHLKSDLAQHRYLRWLPMTCFICAGIFGVVGVLLFCDPMDMCKDYAGWSFILTIIGSCLYLVGGAPLAWRVSFSAEYQRM